MRAPVSSESMPGKIQKSSNFPAYMNNPLKPIRPGSALPFQLQLQLKSLREYVNDCRSTLNDIHNDFEHFKMDPDNPFLLSGISKQLGRFCLEADSWEFHSLYNVAFALQMMILQYGGRNWSHRLCEAFDVGLDTLLDLIERCETDLRWEVALNETFECLSHAGRETMVPAE